MSSSKGLFSGSQSLRKEIQCNCGNRITYDDIQLNCAFPAYKTLRCSLCDMEHRIVLDGALGDITGAK